ncbi:MAG TPA: leucine--tRNA ligase [Candidatus Saccharimonadales bacterium]|nr:leucine--tRNA ligase [Candidatus Saccharimonadales bacterium]
MQRYSPKEIESRWQQKWQADKIYQASEDPAKPKKYVLEYFPYPSGAAMHVGHVRNYTIGDALARHGRMSGYNVLHPMGWDAFGLPAENYAIKNKVSPRQAIDENTARFKQQLMQMGFSYDWSREIDSTDPKYYKWTQWFFLLLYKKGLAYQQEALVNWDPVEKTVLANEQVIDGRGERSGAPVEKKSLKQWFFKITDYADRLLDDLDDLNWSDSIKTMQRNWIGRSKGAEVDFGLDFGDPVVNDRLGPDGKKAHLTVFTTRPDTLFGATYLVLAPEHPWLRLALEHQTVLQNNDDVAAYVEQAGRKSELERQSDQKDKTGVELKGVTAINPVNGGHIPIWVADYVLSGYGTGAIMAVPAHDERDYEFAKKFELPIIRVVKNSTPDDECTPDEGTMMNSDEYDGLASEAMREKIVADLEKSGVAKEITNYKMRDWLISRQRYWGAPIPIIHCTKDGIVPVPADQLPVLLPEVKSYEPTGDGRSPLANIPEFVNTTCPKCGGPAERETDTMDGFACSSWYFLRFADPHNDEKAFAKDKADFWLPVDDYIGGAEHAVMHLLYARFWTKVMYDEKLINFTEPFTTLRNQGMILAPDGQKMSKSKGNTIEPDGLIEQGYGADSIRLMELFIGPWNQSANWSVEGMGGSFRFLQRVWTLAQELLESGAPAEKSSEELLKSIHRTIKKVDEDLRALSFNTAIAALMECVNDLYKIKAEQGYEATDWRWALETLLQLLAPFAPHITEELWHQLGHAETIHLSPWPQYDETYLVRDTVTIAVQVNGKLRGEVEVPADAAEADVLAAAQAHDKVAGYVHGQTVKKSIYVPGRLVNFVI